MISINDDMILKFQRGTPILLEDVCAIYPATMGEIIDIGYTTFQQYLSTITTQKPVSFKGQDKELKELLEPLTDFQYILLMASLDKLVNTTLKDAFQFFTHENVVFSVEPPQIVIGPPQETHIITEPIFYDLQHILRRMYFVDGDDEEIVINDSDSETTKNIKMMMRRNREKVKQAKAKKAAREKSDLKLSDLIGSITIDNCGLNMENIWNITYYAFHDQLKRMGWRDQFNINNQAALAGAKLKKNQLKHWMRSISSPKDN